MIAKILKLIANPQGIFVQAILEQVAKVFKSQKVLEYVEMENELDKAVKDLKIEQEAMKGFFKGFQDQIDSIKKMAHPPAIPLKEINEFRETNKDVKWIMGVLNKMKKLPLLKSVFKGA